MRILHGTTSSATWWVLETHIDEHEMKKLLSYLIPLTQKVESNESGTLEINWLDGKKMLDSKNANYSFGPLQAVLTFGLSEVSIDPTDRTLLLGMGAGSILHPLREKFKCVGHIKAVEFDQRVIDLAISDFGILKIDDLEIIHADASAYVAQCSEKFNLIIVDLFIDNLVPEVFYSRNFWEDIVQLLESDGKIIFNAGINLGDSQKYADMVDSLETRLNLKKYESVKGINTLLIGKARG
ncbi:MAG TPA: spermine synthase [Flavobacteriales bacterium]|nr:spermine synthase [Flavobacteriales bacterium]HIO71495.1 spermine synthase [Flavobacteriales bacterium]